MVKTKREYILITFFISFISTAITITSISTNNWINADSIFYKTKEKSGVANYGLFSGEWNVDIGRKYYHNINIRCIVSENICGWSYESTSTKQLNEIKDIYEGNGCSKENNENELKCDLSFLNAALWICTLMFIFFSLFCSISTMLLSVLNYFTNPTRDIFSVYGLLIGNCVASIGYLMGLIMWGSEFAAFISNNIAISDTLKGIFSSEGLASLGYSYWILLGPLFLHIANMGIIYYRNYQIDKEPPIPKIDVDPSKDGISFLY